MMLARTADCVNLQVRRTAADTLKIFSVFGRNAGKLCLSCVLQELYRVDTHPQFNLACRATIVRDPQSFARPRSVESSPFPSRILTP
jgi:hypothetical protein